jgi:hypothetical protein
MKQSDKQGLKTMNNVLDLFDQTVFDGERATGATNLLQVVWMYNSGVDIDGLRRFHAGLRQGRLSRRIERSPLPFGRHRWVSPRSEPELEIVSTPRPRDEFDAWLGEQAGTALDAEHGPGWHLAVLPFTDGGTGVSLVISHCLADGVGLCEALADAASGRPDPIAWPAAGSRGRWQAVYEDARQTMRDLPAIRRAASAAAGLARRANEAGDSGTQSPAMPPVDVDEVVSLPTATVFVDADEWDSRAGALGGTANSLLAGLASRIALRAGRLSTDGSVALTLPVSERTADDTRANAITNIDITVDPYAAALNLRDIRATVKQALIRSRDVLNERWKLLPIAPLLPQWLIRRCVGVSAGSAASVISSNLGIVDPAACRVDGTDADTFVIRTLGPGVTKATMHRLGGLLVVLAGRTQGRVFVSVLAYQPGDSNTNDILQQNLSGALSDFLLSYTPGWACAESAGAAR